VIRAVFFDVGGTLLQPWPSVGSIYARVAARHGIQRSAGELERSFRESWKAFKVGELTLSRREWWRQLVFRTLGCEHEACFEELYDFFSRPEAWRLYPDVEETLRVVRERGLHVGVISNWDSRLRPLLNAMGLGEMFDSMTISCEVGAEKPSPAIFQAALRRTDASPGQTLHVGDNDEEDVRGARAVGMRAVLIDRSGRPASQDGFCGGLREILALTSR
jgi:putative hydrolase of the HAD superfamily